MGVRKFLQTLIGALAQPGVKREVMGGIPPCAVEWCEMAGASECNLRYTHVHALTGFQRLSMTRGAPKGRARGPAPPLGPENWVSSVKLRDLQL